MVLLKIIYELSFNVFSYFFVTCSRLEDLLNQTDESILLCKHKIP